MIELIEAYQNLFTGQMFPETLLEILEDKDPFVKVENVRNGVMILTNNKVIKCVSEYYEPLQGPATRKGSSPSVNAYLSCRNTRRSLGLEDIISNCDCKRCHAQCIMLERFHGIKRKQKRKRR